MFARPVAPVADRHRRKEKRRRVRVRMSPLASLSSACWQRVRRRVRWSHFFTALTSLSAVLLIQSFFIYIQWTEGVSVAKRAFPEVLVVHLCLNRSWPAGQFDSITWLSITCNITSAETKVRQIFLKFCFYILPNDNANRCTIDTRAKPSYISVCSSLHYV